MIQNAKDYYICAIASIAFLLHYSFFDVFGVGPTRRKYGIKYPHSDGPVPFLRAMRTQQNQLEQFPVFLTFMWINAFFYDPKFAGIAGCIWAFARIMYSFTYRCFTVNIKCLAPYTCIAYLSLYAMAFTTLFTIAEDVFGSSGSAWALVIGVIAFLFIGLFVQSKYLFNKKEKEDEVEANESTKLSAKQ